MGVNAPNLIRIRVAQCWTHMHRWIVESQPGYKSTYVSEAKDAQCKGQNTLAHRQYVFGCTYVVCTAISISCVFCCVWCVLPYPVCSGVYCYTLRVVYTAIPYVRCVLLYPTCGVSSDDGIMNSCFTLVHCGDQPSLSSLCMIRG